jgi:uncharacterized membrane protein
MELNGYAKAICLGIIAGMRSMSAPAFTSAYLARQRSPALANSALSLMGSPRVANALKVAAVGEMIADKLPIIPDRISPGPLVARALSGALCGAALCRAEGKSLEGGAIAGGLSAIVSTYALYHLRRKIGEARVVPDAALGFAEDAIVIGSGLSLLSHEDAAAQASAA